MLSTQLNLLDVISGDLKQQSENNPRGRVEQETEETLDEVPPQPSVSSMDP
jgi:hypothetical protein